LERSRIDDDAACDHARRAAAPDRRRAAPPERGALTGRPRPTLNSVAERAGVSKSLVSLVMRGAPNVSDARREAVLRAAAELGYRPNLAARTLVERRTRTLGVLVSDLHNPFFAEVVDGVYAEAGERGLRLLLGTGRRDARSEVDVVDSFLQRDVEGVILLGPALTSAAVEEIARTAPTVVVARRFAAGGHCDVIANDDALGAELAVAHLAALGHRRIAHIEGREGGSAIERRAGYEAAMVRRGLGGEVLVAAGDSSDEGGYRGARQLLAAPVRPTAIFAYNDLAAVGALTALGEAGLTVPGDVSLVGYDNTYLAAIRHLSLTSVDQPRERMGRLAVRTVQERAAPPGRLHILEPSLRVRRSSGPVTPRA
jgi:DNA-binding LacI/PurR family transcriptional regulator